MDAGELIKIILPGAVALRIIDFKQLPWEQIQSIATEASQFIGEHGDNILFMGPKKGDTAKAFNELSKGVAALAFVPGGVTLFGMHFEATHPETLTAGQGRWLYHPVFSDELALIAKEGLVPREKGTESVYPKIFFTGLLSEAVKYAEWAFGESDFKTADPVLLRVHAAHLDDVQQEHASTDDWYVERKVPAVFVQAWVPEKKAWIEVREVVKQGYFDPRVPLYGWAPDEFIGYIEAAWPK